MELGGMALLVGWHYAERELSGGGRNLFLTSGAQLANEKPGMALGCGG